MFGDIKQIKHEIENLKYENKRLIENYWKQQTTIYLLLKELGYEEFTPDNPLPSGIRKVT